MPDKDNKDKQKTQSHECIFGRVGIGPDEIITTKKLETVKKLFTWIIGTVLSIVALVLVIMGLVLKSNIQAQEKYDAAIEVTSEVRHNFELYEARKEQQDSQVLTSLNKIQTELTQQRKEVQEIRGGQDLILEHLLKSEHRQVTQ